MLNFTGIGAAYQPEFGSNSAYFIVDKHLYVIDSGESVFLEMKKRFEDFKQFQAVTFLITHMHSDHCGSLASFVSYLKNIVKIKPTIIYPQTAISSLLNLFGIDNKSYQHVPEYFYEDDHIQVQFYPTEHVSKLSCFGFKLTLFGQVIYYSGDAVSIPTDILEAFKDNKIDRLYQDVTVNPENNSHMYYKDLLTIIPEALQSKVYCMHLDKEAFGILKQYNLKTVQVAD